MPALGPAPMKTKVLEAMPLGEGQTRLVLEDTGGYLASHVQPGQYCMLGMAKGPASPFALMSTPNEASLSFLIRDQGEPGQSLAAAQPGDEVEVGSPQGPGFDLAACAGRDVVLVATGTGIAPIRAALTSMLQDRGTYGAISLYYGLRNRSHCAVEEELPAWIEAGISVRLHFSDSCEGYVQDRVTAELADPSTRAYVVAGHRGVADVLRAHANGQGPVVENL